MLFDPSFLTVRILSAIASPLLSVTIVPFKATWADLTVCGKQGVSRVSRVEMWEKYEGKAPNSSV